MTKHSLHSLPRLFITFAASLAMHMACACGGDDSGQAESANANGDTADTAIDGQAADAAQSSQSQATSNGGTGQASPGSGGDKNGNSAPGGASTAAQDPQAASGAAAPATDDPGMAAAAGATSTKPKHMGPPGSVSKPGEYSGYYEKEYDGYELSSLYVPVRDGTKLAVDLYRPKKGGQVTDTPLPVLWMHTPYNRRYFASTAGAGLAGEVYPGAAARLVEYGYIAAVVDYRGLYASYGKNEGFNRGEWVDAARLDAYDITEWFAEQPWSNGNIGMWGCSATGGSQMQALTTAPPHLKAIFPMSCEFDVYPFGVPGGMAATSGDTKAPPSASSSALRDGMAEPVDDDPGGTQLRAAVAEHANNIENPGYAPFRDSVASNIPEVWWAKSSPHTYIDTVLESGIAVYAAANWDEAATKYGAFFTFNNLGSNPHRLIVGPETHCAWFDVQDSTGFDLLVEERRFFDYFLKDIDNGIMEEPGVYYYTYNETKDKAWRSSETWPLANEQRTPYYLGARTLSMTAPTDASAKDDTVVDYNVTMGTTSTSGPSNPRGIAYATEPLAQDVRVTGHPVAELWVASTATDGDFIATLQDVGPSGAITSYNMHGRLRASQRKETDPPYNNLELPYHPFGMNDAMPLTPGEPTLLRFDLLPTSFLFKAGHRIQVTLSFADTPTPRITPAPTVSIFHDADHPSKIILPIIPED